MIETQVNQTVWIETPQTPPMVTETPYAVAWLCDNGKLWTGRVIGVQGAEYVVSGGSCKADYSWAWLENVAIADTFAIGGAWVYPQDVDAMLWARFDDGSERRALCDRLQRFEWDLNGVGGWQYD